MTKNNAARTGPLSAPPSADKIESVGANLPSPARFARVAPHALARTVVAMRWSARCRRHRIEDAERELDGMRGRLADIRAGAETAFAELLARDIREAARVDEWTSTWLDGPDGPVANLPPEIRRAVR